MSLRSLSLLVLLVLLGTGVSVHWYLQADQTPAPQPCVTAPAPELQHVPLPMRAEPARRRAPTTSSRSILGVARTGQAVPELADREPQPAPATATGEPSSAGVFQPPLRQR